MVLPPPWVFYISKERMFYVRYSVSSEELVCFCFARMDKRTSDLVRYGEAALRSEQLRLANLTGNDDFNIARSSDKNRGPWPYTYREIIRFLLWVSLILFVLVAVISLIASKHAQMLVSCLK